MASLTAAFAVGCSALLGIDDTHFGDADGGVGGADAPDAGANGTDATVEGGAPDGAPPGDGATDAKDAAHEACAPDASFASDPRNCGACGHDCRGGMCASSACQPYQIADDSQVRGIAVDGTTIWWTHSSGDVSRSDKRAWLDASVAYVDPSEGYGIAATEAGIAWAVHSGLAGSSIALAGPTNGVQHFATPTPRWVRGSGAAVYWLGNLPTGANPPGVGWLDPDAGSVATGGLEETDLALDDTYYYWGGVDGIHRSLRNASLGDSLVTDAVLAIAVRGQNLYWIPNATLALMTCPLPGCSPGSQAQLTSLAAFQATAARLAVDDTNVYVAMQGQAPGVVACAVVGCATATIIKQGQPALGDIAVDDAAVYWASYELGTPASQGVWAVVK